MSFSYGSSLTTPPTTEIPLPTAPSQEIIHHADTPVPPMSYWSPGTVSWLLYFAVLVIGIVLAFLVFAYWPRSSPLLVPPVTRRIVGVLQPCNDIANVCRTGLVCYRPNPNDLGTCRRPLGQVCSTVSECVPEATACANGICVRATQEMLDIITDRPTPTTVIPCRPNMVNNTVSKTIIADKIVDVASLTINPMPGIVASLPVGRTTSMGTIVTPCFANQQCPSGSCMTTGKILLWDPNRQAWTLHSNVPSGVTFTRLIPGVNGELWAISTANNADTSGIYHYENGTWVQVGRSGLWNVQDSQGAMTSYRLIDLTFSSKLGLIGVYNVIQTVDGQSVDQGNRVYRVSVVGKEALLIPFRTSTGLQIGPDLVLTSISEIDANEAGDLVVVNQDPINDRATVFILPITASAEATFQPIGVDVPSSQGPLRPRFYNNQTTSNVAGAPNLILTIGRRTVALASASIDDAIPNDLTNVAVDLVNGQQGRVVVIGRNQQDNSIFLNVNGQRRTVGFVGSGALFAVSHGVVIMYSPSSCS